MLSYQHEYHAGNHADVVKHSVLALLIDALQRKPTAIRIIDSHAGAGSYDMTSRETQQRREFAEGIERVLGARPVPPRAVSAKPRLAPITLPVYWPVALPAKKAVLRCSGSMVLSIAISKKLAP